jgi:hypothetical protein
MPRIVVNRDNLNDRNLEFEQVPLSSPLFLNSVPKCGTHLIRNIFRMFVPVEQQYHDMFIQLPMLQDHLAAFDTKTPKLSWGHLLFSDDSAMATHGVNQVLIVRDPYSWVLARARFMLSKNFDGSMEKLRSGKITIEQVLSLMIFGIYQVAPTMEEFYTNNAIAWLGTGIKLVHFEDLVKHVKNIDTPEAETYFADLLSDCGFDELPSDWKERVIIGSDRKQSGTARENLADLRLEVPNELPEINKQMVDYAAPGLRKLLGYE